MELDTETKMFCRCPNTSDEIRPNTNVCPICLAHPGAMPVANKQAIESILKLGLALGGNIPEKAFFDRKSYFYPDLPKGYQLSQYEHPFVKGGNLCGVKLTRIHLEEDAGKLVHGSDGKTYVDLNRAGVPLVELVTEPCISSSAKASEFAKALQTVIRYIGISKADMEKGNMRLEANISVRPKGTEKLGTKVEVKNLNSFRALEGAIEYEIKRQSEALDNGERIIQETRGWNAEKLETYSQRSKEEAHDYRYHPEPDIPPIDLTDKDFIDLEAIRLSLPELPEAKKARLIEQYGLSEAQASSLIEDKKIAEYFENCASESDEELAEKKEDERNKAYSSIANYIVMDLRGIMNAKGSTLSETKITPENMADLAILIANGELSSRMAKDLLAKMEEKGIDPRTIMEEEGIKQVSDEGPILEAVQAVIEANAKAVADYKAGKEASFQFLFGQTMAKMKGQGSPDTIKKVLQEALK